jgi:hypothetical protein
MTRLLRASLPLIAIATAIGLALSDWPLGWRMWLEHPYIAALAGGASLLFVAGAVIDSHMRRREAHRWHGLGFAAAGEFAAILYDTTIAIAALAGSDDGYRLRSDVEFHLVTARERASDLLRRDTDAPGESDEGDAPHDDIGLRQLSVLVADEAWRRSCSQTLRVSRSHLVEAVSRWTATFAILNDDEDFNRVARTVTIMDLITVLHISLVAVRPPGEEAHLDARALADFAAQWQALHDAVDTELDFWNARRRVGTRIELPALGPQQPSAPGRASRGAAATGVQ